jgi:hypothetical protein
LNVLPETKTIADRIFSSSLFRLNGERIDICPELIALADAIKAEPDDDNSWLYYGEGGECCLSDFIPGAYWALTQWHGGQFSDSYRAVCALGSIFSPGMSSLDEDNYGEKAAYEAVSEHFASAA